MDSIDEALTRLARAPMPIAFDGLEARVLARIATPRAFRVGLGMGAMPIAALAIGLIGGGIPASLATATPLSPFAANAPFAPSTLLAGVQ